MTNEQLTDARKASVNLRHIPGHDGTLLRAIGYIIEDLCDEVERLQKYEEACTENDL